MPDLTTTIGHVKKFGPCTSSYRKFVNGVDKYIGDETEVKLSDVLRICGVEDAIWFLRCFRYEEYCIVCADIAESVLRMYERKVPGDSRPRKAIEEVRLYYYGYSTKKSLIYAANDAADAAAAAAYAAAAAAAYAAAAAAYADAAAAYAYAANAQWEIIENILIKFILS